MNFRGVIIGESLEEISVLQALTVVKTEVEPITFRHKTPWLKQWTLYTVDIPEDIADKIAEQLSKSFDPVHPNWYADYKNIDYHYIIFANHIFKVDLKNPVLYEKAREYGLSLGIPEYQVNFKP